MKTRFLMILPHFYFRYCLKFITPLLISIIFNISCTTKTETDLKKPPNVVFILACYHSSGISQEVQRDVNIIYGDKHIYTIETPINWINDKEATQTIGLTNFFYHSDDVDKEKKSYMYTHGMIRPQIQKICNHLFRQT